MNLPDADIIVLDAHGVVFNNPLPTFLNRVGERTGESGPDLLIRWRTSIRVPFWCGDIDDAEMWAVLAPELDPSDLRAELEKEYEPGPLFSAVTAPSDRELWLLSNHRSDWLHERLERFGLIGRFDRLLISDRLGVPKPCPQAYRHLEEASRNASLVFVDDSHSNVRAARDLGINSHHVEEFADTHPSIHVSTPQSERAIS